MNGERGKKSGLRFSVRRIKGTNKENELYYIAGGTCFYDSLSPLRDGMRCTESK